MCRAHFKNLGKCLIMLVLWGISAHFSKAQVTAYYSSCQFNTPKNQAYLETYMTLIGKSFTPGKVENGLQSYVGISVLIKKDSAIIKQEKYNLRGPVYTATANAPNFIDVQRYPLANGTYEIELKLNDNFDPLNKTLTIKQTINIQFNGNTIESSDIQALESFYRSTSQNTLTKNDFDLMPYTVNYYPESTKQLCFYFESYNTDKVLGANKPFLYNYYIETENKHSLLESYHSIKKELSAPVNPLLARIDITKLGSGNYNLVIELKDETNTTRLTKKYFFQRLNRTVDVVALQEYSEKKSLADYVGQCNNADTLKMFVECLWPIANGVDKERIINQALKKDPELMKKFVVDFWQRRAADTANPLKLWANYYLKVQAAMALFKCGKQKGYYTERGRIFLQYGAPSQRTQQPNEPNTYPYEIWLYYQTTDAVNGQNFSNRRFVFVNKNLGDDCYTLVHSDMRGEVNNPRWQFELTRRNNNGLGNPDNENPNGIQDNQFNEIYSNPR